MTLTIQLNINMSTQLVLKTYKNTYIYYHGTLITLTDDIKYRISQPIPT